MQKKSELVKAIILLPGLVLIGIPGTLLHIFRPFYFLCEFGFPLIFIPLVFSALLLFSGIIFIYKTVSLFTTVGHGTPAPWMPPTHFVVRGPYCYVRNPMILSVLSILLAESILFGSVSILGWFCLFWVVNTFYFIWFEEPGLVNRFGNDYLVYKKNVRRWIPRISPWEQDN